MNSLFGTLSIILFSTLISPDNGQIEVQIENIKSDKGVLLVALFENEDSFLKKAFKSKIVTLEEAKIPISFKNIPAGRYAVSVIHDENENGELDTNWAGIPKEPFGFSKKTMGRFGAPSFEDTCIEVSNGTSQTTVKMKVLF